MNPTQALQAKVLAIIGALFAAVSAWKPATNLENIVGDVGTVIGTIETIDPQAIPKSIAQEVEAIPAEMSALATGSVAIAGEVPASFDGQADKIIWFGVRKYEGLTPPAGSQADTLKKLFGT